MSFVPQLVFQGANLYGGGPEVNLAPITHAIFVPTGTIITNAQLATLKTQLQTMLTTDTLNTRSFLVGQLSDMKEVGMKPTYDKVDTQEILTTEGSYAHTFIVTIKGGGKGGHEQLRKFNGNHASYDVIYVDANYNLFGLSVPDTNGLQQLGGFQLSQLVAEPFSFPTYQKISQYNLRLAFVDQHDFNDSSLIVPAGFAVPRILKGVLDVTGTPLSGTAGSFTGTFFTNGGLINLAGSAMGGSALAAPGAWTFFNETLGSACTISACTLNAAGTGYNYTISAGSNVTGNIISAILKPISVTSASPYNKKYLSQEVKVYGTW